MVARPFVPHVVQIVFSGDLGGAHNWVNKLFARYTGGAPSTADLNAMATALVTVWTASMTPLQPIETSLTEVEITDLASAVGAVGVATTVTAGTRAGGLIAGDDCALASIHLARHYRGGHPRTYLSCGVTTDLLTQSTWQPAFVTDAQAAWRQVINTMVDTFGALVVASNCNVSYFGPPTLPNGHSTPRLVPLVDDYDSGNVTISPELASQRRRIGRK